MRSRLSLACSRVRVPPAPMKRIVSGSATKRANESRSSSVSGRNRSRSVSSRTLDGDLRAMGEIEDGEEPLQPGKLADVDGHAAVCRGDARIEPARSHLEERSLV